MRPGTHLRKKMNTITKTEQVKKDAQKANLLAIVSELACLEKRVSRLRKRFNAARDHLAAKAGIEGSTEVESEAVEVYNGVTIQYTPRRAYEVAASYRCNVSGDAVKAAKDGQVGEAMIRRRYIGEYENEMAKAGISPYDKLHAAE